MKTLVEMQAQFNEIDREIRQLEIKTRSYFFMKDLNDKLKSKQRNYKRKRNFDEIFPWFNRPDLDRPDNEINYVINGFNPKMRLRS